jgi:hypothetical protein
MRATAVQTARKVESPVQILERLSIGERVQDRWVAGLLDLDPLVVSRWLCGEDLRGIYQPIVLHRCTLEGLDLEGRTFYEAVELLECQVAAAHFKRAYFYSSLLVEDCTFEGDFEGQEMQSDGRLIVCNTTFAGWAEFGDMNLRGEIDLVDVSFPGGTNLLRVLTNGSRERLGREIRISGCRFRPGDVPADLGEHTTCPVQPWWPERPAAEAHWASRRQPDPRHHLLEVFPPPVEQDRQ